MAIFANTLLENDYSHDYVNVDPTMEGSAQIMYEFASDMYKLISATYISDIMIESAISEGATDIEGVMEKTVSDFAKAAKERFIKLKDQIKAWFKRIRDKFKAFFLSAEKFVQTYEKQILENLKRVGSYKYYGYKFTDDGPCSIATEEINKIKGIVDTIGTSVEKGEADRIKEHLDGVFGSDTGVTGKKEEFQKQVRGGQTNTVEITVSEATAKKMIKAISNHKVVIADLNKLEASTEKNINKMIDELKKDESKKATADIVSKKVKLFNNCISGIQALNSMAASEENIRYKQYHAALKKILFAKKTESFDGGESTEGSSIFESALNMLA